MKISFNREIDLKYDVDVFIAGGGPAGAAAAVAAAENGLALLAQMPSPVRGGDGNTEFLALFARVEGGTDEGKDRN